MEGRKVIAALSGIQAFRRLDTPTDQHRVLATAVVRVTLALCFRAARQVRS